MKFSSTPRECGTAIFQMYWIMALNPPERHFGESIEFGGLRASRREMKRKRKAKEVVRLLTFARSNYRIGAGATFERTCSAIPPWTLGERIRPGRSNRRQSALWPPIIDAWLWAKRWWWSVNLSSHWKQEEVSIRLETYRRAQVTVEKVVTAQKMEAKVIKKKKKENCSTNSDGLFYVPSITLMSNYRLQKAASLYQPPKWRSLLNDIRLMVSHITF